MYQNAAMLAAFLLTYSAIAAFWYIGVPSSEMR